MQQFWIDAYEQAKLTNVLTDMKLSRVEAAAISHDKYYDAITVRIYGSGHDYTVRDADKHVVGGNPRQDRRYTEYCMENQVLIQKDELECVPCQRKVCPLGTGQCMVDISVAEVIAAGERAQALAVAGG